jgi:hypothetical protein
VASWERVGNGPFPWRRNVKETELISRIRREAQQQSQINQILHTQLTEAVAMLKTITNVACGFAWDAGVREAELERKLASVYPAIEHGDEAHRAWLKAKMDAVISGSVP